MLALETLSNIACAAVEPDGGEGPPAEVEGEGDGERDLARDMLALCGKNVAGASNHTINMMYVCMYPNICN